MRSFPREPLPHSRGPSATMTAKNIPPAGARASRRALWSKPHPGSDTPVSHAPRASDPSRKRKPLARTTRFRLTRRIEPHPRLAALEGADKKKRIPGCSLAADAASQEQILHGRAHRNSPASPHPKEAGPDGANRRQTIVALGRSTDRPRTNPHHSAGYTVGAIVLSSAHHCHRNCSRKQQLIFRCSNLEDSAIHD